MSRNASYRKIDYRLRVAKAIERKMMLDLLRRLDRLANLTHYRYVGFGSPHFADFSMIHRSLGIHDMISIEHEIDDEPRFRFNAPFASIDLRFGTSTDVLPQIRWDQRSIVWLDYDGRLDTDKLEDVDFLVRNVAGASVVIFSVNAHPPSEIELRHARAKEDLGDALPRSASNESLGGWGTAEMYREVIQEQIDISLSERNAGQSSSNKVFFQQLFNFHYSDGAKMLTVGGILYDAGLQGQLAGCSFGDFDYYRDGIQPYSIPLPRLTFKEMQHLNSLLPSDQFSGLSEAGIPAGDADAYSRVYRYFPNFVDIAP